MAKVRADDPVRGALATVLEQWHEHLGTGVAYTVQRLILKQRKSMNSTPPC
jgi:hypothetical protein